jgi:hypothetical protein
MMFILRTIFWLALVSAMMPARDDDTPGLGETTGRIVGAAMDYCATKPGDCVESARATAEAIRIPAEFVMRAQGFVTAGPGRPLVPQPVPRPASL